MDANAQENVSNFQNVNLVYISKKDTEFIQSQYLFLKA